MNKLKHTGVIRDAPCSVRPVRLAVEADACTHGGIKIKLNKLLVYSA